MQIHREESQQTGVALRVMQPEYRIERRVRNNAHMPPIPHQTMNNIMHIFNAVVSAASTVGVSRVGEWCIIGLLRDELVGKDSKAVFLLQSATRRRGHPAC